MSSIATSQRFQFAGCFLAMAVGGVVCAGCFDGAPGRSDVAQQPGDGTTRDAVEDVDAEDARDAEALDAEVLIDADVSESDDVDVASVATDGDADAEVHGDVRDAAVAARDTGPVVTCEQLRRIFDCEGALDACFPFDPSGDRGACDFATAFCENWWNCGAPGNRRAVDWDCFCDPATSRWRCRIAGICRVDAGGVPDAEDTPDAPDVSDAADVSD